MIPATALPRIRQSGTRVNTASVPRKCTSEPLQPQCCSRLIPVSTGASNWGTFCSSIYFTLGAAGRGALIKRWAADQIWSAAAEEAEGRRRLIRSPGDAAFASRGAAGVCNSPSGLSCADTSAPRPAKAASPVVLIKHRTPSAAALHMVTENGDLSTSTDTATLRWDPPGWRAGPAGSWQPALQEPGTPSPPRRSVDPRH